MVRLLALLAMLALGLPTAFGKDLTDADLPPPAFEASHLLLKADSKLPKGWSLRLEGPEATARTESLVAAVREALKPALTDTSQVAILGRELIGPQSAAATAAVVRAPVTKGAPPPDVRKPLEALAEASGWSLREVGSPACVLLVAAPAAVRNDLVVAAAQWAAEALALRAETAFDATGPFVTLANLNVALALDPRCVRAHSFAGNMRFILAFAKREHGSFERAAKHNELALAEDAPYPFTPARRLQALVIHGGNLLMVPGQDQKAYEALVAAVANPLLRESEEYWGARYNLACAAARLKKLDQAFPEIEAVLAKDAKDGVQGIEHWREDPDFETLRADPRWKALLAKYPKEE